jgi:hypothetical protein
MRHLSERERLEVRVALQRERDLIDKELLHTDTPYGRAPLLERREVFSELIRIFAPGSRVLLPFEGVKKPQVKRAVGR